MCNYYMDALILKYGKSDPKRVFKSIETYLDLIKANVAYLEGKVTETPYHLTPVMSETVPLLGKLVKINKKGFVSTGGQPAECVYGEYVAHTWKNEHGEEQGNWYYDSEQKSHIEGVFPKMYMNKLRAHLDKKDVYYYIVDKHAILYSNISENDYTMTRSKNHKNKAKVSEQTWKQESNVVGKYVLKAYQDMYKFFGTREVNYLFDNAVFVNIVGKKYCQGSVEDVLLEFLESDYWK